MTQIQVLAPADAGVERLVARVVRIINQAYAIGEAGMWLDGERRTAAGEISDAIRLGEMLVASGDGGIEGCARVRRLDDSTADFGMLAVKPDQWGKGVGGALVNGAEERMRSRGVTTMQLELLVPTQRRHPEKERLRDWYTRLGYQVSRTATLDQVVVGLASQLSVPCEFLIFHKRL